MEERLKGLGFLDVFTGSRDVVIQTRVFEVDFVVLLAKALTFDLL
jgi:hypothetical protein